MDSNKCNANYKYILNVIIIAILAVGIVYLLLCVRTQNNIIKDQERYINELKSEYIRDNVNNDPLLILERFADKWLPFRKILSDIEILPEPENISKSFNRDFADRNTMSYYSVTTSTTENEYIITIALPDFSKEDIEVELQGNILKISANNSGINQANEENVPNARKQVINALPQSIKLPPDISGENISTTLTNGLLTITLPRLPDKVHEPRKILIE